MLILASQSPRRAELLRNAGITFEIRPVEVDERARQSEGPLEYVRRLAEEKAMAALEDAPQGALVLGADTTVVVDGEILGKPADQAEAKRMLERLSGRIHQVITGVCLARHTTNGAPVTEVESETTEVEFAPLSDVDIADYVGSGEPMDKAGAYGIQGRASRWIPRIHGCYFNVVGLPVARVCAMLARAERRLEV